MSDISKLIGDRIRFFRQDRGYSQEQLALKANLNVSFLGQVERGIKNSNYSIFTR
ncbi:helix-turn-helix domain-containing protein [Clostridium sp. 19966]|uniref:helix-turn-helix domain-containing protein n=1 Tax=Clostridium sp. 19966 TaxID=2768166 RepID=UPI0028DD5D43|nr:helix-turn-helix domain-containing protein [Clostridium sp. 19966]MDT8718418.1 helix-turn-helix domain-containing protein [Clostridium sp. 19966]